MNNIRSNVIAIPYPPITAEDGDAVLNLSNPPIQVAFDTGSGVVQRLEYFVLRRRFDNPC